MKRVIILAVLQVGVMLAWAGHHEWTRHTAPTFRVPLQPADPYDVLRGRYFRVRLLDAAIRPHQAGFALSRESVSRFMQGRAYFQGAALVGFCREQDLNRLCALVAADSLYDDNRAQFWSRANVTVSSMSPGNADSNAAPGWVVNVDFGFDRFFLPNRIELPARENAPGWALEVCHRPGLSPLPRRLWHRDRLVAGS